MRAERSRDQPGATDLPDLAFVDSDCDGIDGREAKAVFVSPVGKDTNPGTKAAPKRLIDAARGRGGGSRTLRGRGRRRLRRGDAATGVGIFGGYDAKTWQRGKSQTTRIVGATQGLLADHATGVTLQLLTVTGSFGGLEPSVYGIRAVNGSSLTLQSVTVIAASGVSGLTGVNGKAGANGANGEAGHPGTGRGAGGCVSEPSYRDPSDGGLGGISPAGRTGGNGGDGGPEGGNDGKRGGDGRVGIPGGAGGGGGNRAAPARTARMPP